MIQDAPQWAGQSVGASLIRDLHSRHPNVVRYAKPESVPFAELTAALTSTPSLGVFSGLGGASYLDSLDLGRTRGNPICRVSERAECAHRAAQRCESRCFRTDTPSSKLPVPVTGTRDPVFEDSARRDGFEHRANDAPRGAAFRHIRAHVATESCSNSRRVTERVIRLAGRPQPHGPVWASSLVSYCRSFPRAY